MLAFLYRGKPRLPALVWLAAWALTQATGTGARGAEPPALIVNQHPVSQKEFRWFMEQERAAVFRHFSGHQVNEGKDFWDQKSEGTTPRAMLKSNTVARVIREKAEQILF